MEKQLSIGFYSSSLSKGGLELNMLRYAGYLRKESLIVVIFCVKNSPIYQIANQEGFEIVEIKRNKRYWDFSCALALKKSIKSLALDWLWFRDPRDMDTLAWSKILGSNAKILYHQGMQMASPKKSMFHRIRFSQINQWICLSESLKQQVLDFTSFPVKKISVLPLALPDDSKAKDYQSGEFQALVVGRWDPLKNQHLVINAFLLLNKKYPELRLTFIGESTLGESNQYEKDNKKKVRHLDLQNVIQFKPFQFDLSEAFAESHLLIIPSINETFGMVTIEGMRAGLPLLGSNTGGTKALIHDNKCGLTFDPEDAQSLADQWSVIMDNHQLRLEYSRNARTAFETHYHIEGQMTHLMKILKGK
jgi:glycosyltransferase involved in cell wall biosynthesis